MPISSLSFGCALALILSFLSLGGLIRNAIILVNVIKILLTLYACHKAFLKFLLQLGILLHKMHMLTTRVSGIALSINTI